MAWRTVIWDHEPGGNVEHIAERGYTPEDVEIVLASFDYMDVSRSTGNLLLYGFIGNDRVIVPVIEIDEDTVYPQSCYIPDNERF